MSRFRTVGRLVTAATLATAFALGSAAAQTAAPPPAPVIVMVDMQQLVYNSKAGKGVQGQMDKQRQAFSKEVAQQEDELGIIDRLDEEDSVVPAEGFDRPPHVGIWMNRKDDEDIRSRSDPGHRIAYPG